MKRLPFVLSGCAYGVMTVSIVTRTVSNYPLAQETMMMLAGLYLLVSNITNIAGRRKG